MDIRRSRWQSLVAAAGVACLALTAAACSSSSNTSSSTPAASSSAPAATTSAAATTPAATPTGSSTGSSSGVPATLTGTAKTIATNWVTFFNAKTPTATRVSLLENGSTFESVIAGQASNPQGADTSAAVTAVTVTSSTAATVTWNLLLSGTAVLTNQKGQAVYEGGTWKVAQSSFCGLLALQPPAPAACKS